MGKACKGREGVSRDIQPEGTKWPERDTKVDPGGAATGDCLLTTSSQQVVPRQMGQLP